MSDLRGVTAAETAIATIVDNQLTYRGYDVVDLARRASYPAVGALLWTGELPSAIDLTAIEAQIVENRDSTLIKTYRDGPPPEGDPMPALIAAYANWARDRAPDAGAVARAAATVGALPALTARLLRGRDLRPPRTPGFAGGLLELLRGDLPSQAEARAMNTLLVCFAEHELNASTFAARVVASTLADLEMAIIGGLAALQGPLHGGASRRVQAMLKAVVDGADPETVVSKAGARVPGFGHAVYTAIDPRAVLVRDATLDLLPASRRWVDAADAIADVVTARGKVKPNVDLYAVVLQRSLGIPEAADTPLFAIARSAGWTAHILEQQADNRIIRPRARYVGRPPRPFPAIDLLDR
jgi:citrate synthase